MITNLFNVLDGIDKDDLEHVETLEIFKVEEHPNRFSDMKVYVKALIDGMEFNLYGEEIAGSNRAAIEQAALEGINVGQTTLNGRPYMVLSRNNEG